MAVAELRRRISSCDWREIRQSLGSESHAVLRGLLQAKECSQLAGLFEDDRRFRKRVVMERHGFGRGEYKYFCDLKQHKT